MTSISVVIPAYNRESTLGVSLDSLLAQTHPDWEAIVVDDGSADGTMAIAEEYAARDPRIRAHRQDNGGVSVARNTAIALARHPWLFFLDADDWITPEAFAQLTAALERHPDAQLINGGCTRILADGTEIPEERVAEDDDLFAKFARTCAFSIHTSIVDTALVRGLGGFDASLVTCEDWDLWQRLVRTNVRFASIPENVAYYRVRAGSASGSGVRMMTDGMRLIAQGYGEDPRMQNYPGLRISLEGARTAARTARMYLAAYAAGLEIAREEDGAKLLDLIEDRHPGDADAIGMAHTVFRATAVARGTSVSRWPDYPPAVGARLREFVDALGVFTNDRWFALTMRQTLEELILQHSTEHDELTVGSTRVTRPPLAGPIRAVALHGADRLMVAPRGLPEHEAPLLLPAAGETAPAVVIADAIAATHAWEILRGYMERAVYPALDVQRGARIVVRRGRLKLADAPAAAEVPDDEALHAAAGWIVLLQEVWGRPEWGHDRFYELGEKPAREDRDGPEVAAADLGVVEIAEPLPSVSGVEGPLDVDVALAGLPFARVRVQPTRGTVSAQALRGAISYAAGFELCNVVVREAVLLYDGRQDATLRERLAEAAARRRALDHGANGTLVGGWTGAARDLGLDGAALLGRLRHGALSGAAGRYTLLPDAAAAHVHALAAHTGQPLTEPAASGDGHPAAIVHAPLLVDRAREPVEFGLRSHNRARWFERRHLTGAGPRPVTVAEARRGHVLELVGDAVAGQALQIGCSDPVLTAELSARAGHLVVADISWLALQEAAARCADRANVSFQRTDVFEEPLPGENDLIVVGDVLRWAERPQLLRQAARRLGEALAPGGALVITSSVARADEIWRALHVGRRLELTDEVRTATTRTQRYARRASRLPRPLTKGAEVRRRDVELPEEDAADAGAAGPALGADGAVTGALPILMYHRVADDGEPRARRWRIEPTRLDEQLHHLREQGFQSVDVDEWAAAAALDQPLPGRRIILTFDDGFADFEAAVPILQRHGFTAELFVVTGYVGTTDAWDTAWERREPLMDWQALADLPKDVVRIGSHTVTHAALTAIEHAEVVRELTESRITLEDRLGRRVTTLAYPFGLNDGAVQRIAGAVGYEVAYTTMPWWAYPTRNLLGLPRVEVRGGDSMDAFAASVDRPSR